MGMFALDVLEDIWKLLMSSKINGPWCECCVPVWIVPPYARSSFFSRACRVAVEMNSCKSTPVFFKDSANEAGLLQASLDFNISVCKVANRALLFKK